MKKTRISKIARLPYKTREELNLRLLNGELGGPLLQWLNESPGAKNILEALFGGRSITKQNLSEWRHGAYQDWLRHQHRQENFQQMNEQGHELEGDEGSGDLFENFSRLVLAEMAEALNELHEITNRTDRWKRLREISRDLARLQHGYNHSRKVQLSFDKWNHDAGADEPEEEQQPAAPLSTVSSQLTTTPTVQPSPSKSMQKNPGPPTRRYIRHRKCSRGCICKDCHPDDGDYPYAQALKDYENRKDPDYCQKENVMIFNSDCHCPCDCVKSLAREQQFPTRQLPPDAIPLPETAGILPASRPPAQSIMQVVSQS